VEDDLLVEVVVKYSTSDVLGRDWSEITSELSGHSRQKYQERNRLPDTVEELTFVFLCDFSWFPFLTILTRSHKRHRLGGFYTTSSL
jgi:hypothetical protein